MSEQKPVLYKNWLKAGLGLLYTKQGIQKIVEDVIAGFHIKTYGNIGGHCKTCTTQNVLSCPTRGICGTGRRCNFHDITDPNKQPINCPVNVCQFIRNEIIREHRYSPPSFKNTHAEKWYENPWEIAKCYMVATGYHDVKSADDTDFTGLVSVILNFEPFQQEVNENLAQKGNIFEKARDSRNSIMHNAKMEIPTSDLTAHFLTLKSILTDGKRIQSSLEAQTALRRINDLENDIITITAEDEMKIKEESLRAIKKLRDSSLEKVEQTTREGTATLEQKTRDGTDNIGQKTKEGTDTLEQKTTVGKHTLEQKTTEGRDTLEQTITEGRDTLEKKTTEGRNTLEKKTIEGKDTLEQKTTEGRYTLEQKTTEGKDTLEKKTIEGRDTLEQKTTEGKDTLEKKTTEGRDTLEQKTIEGKDTLEKKKIQGKDTLQKKTTEGRDTLEQKITEGRDTLEQKTIEGKDTLEQKTTEGRDTLEKKITEGRYTLEQKTTEGTNTLNRQTEEHLKNVQTAAASRTSLLYEVGQYLADDLNEITEKGVEKLQEKQAEFEERITGNRCTTIINNYGASNAVNVFDGQNTFERVEFRGNQTSGEPAGLLDEVYLERKKDFQKELIEFYSSSGMTTSPIPVLFDDDDFQVDDIFTMPNMKVLLREREKTTDEREVKINTICGLFKNDTYKRQVVKRVCIKGEAGYGKTFLCKKILSSWCKVHSDIPPDKLTDTDITFLKSFDLLFYLPLRANQTTTTTELIKQVIVREGLHGTLDEILKRESEKCLIILDGLDEYSAAVGIPESDSREKYSIIMTSRPWKIESLRPSQHSLGQEIQLTRMQNNDPLIEAVVDRLNKKYGQQKNWTEFKHETWHEESWYSEKRKEYDKIQHLAEIPVILIQMICMWYDGENIGDKRTEIYKDMLVYLFKLAEKRRPTEMFRLMNEQTTEPKLESDEEKYFQDMKRLFGHTRVASIMFKLAELAFHGLFNSKKEDALIFSHSNKGICNMSKEDVEDCLKIGFLSQEKVQRKVTRQEKLLSFTHKTFQEFFAGLHIASGDETIFKNMLQSLRSLDDILQQREVFIFMIGFKPELLSELSKHIAKVVDSDQRILCYRNPAYHTNAGSFPCGYTFGNDVQEIILSCIDECGESGDDYKVELRDVIAWNEDSKTMIQNLIPRLNCDNIKSLRAYVFTGDLLKKINMKQIVKLELVVESQEEIDILARMMGRSVLNLAALTLDGRSRLTGLSRLTASIKNVLDELVNANQLTDLEISDFNLSHDEILYMCNMFSRWRQLEVISLQCITCQTCKAGRCEYSINLSDNARLRDINLCNLADDVLLGRKLSLERIKIPSLKHGNIVIQQLKDLKTLEELSVCGDTFTYLEERETVKIGISTTVSPDSDIQAHTMASVSTAITEVIPTLHNLNCLVLSFVDLKDDNLLVSCQTQGLVITLAYVTMTLKCLKTLVESILQSPCMIEVHMNGVYIKPKQDTDAALQFIRDSCKFIRDSCNVTPDDGMSDDNGIDISFTNK